VPPVGGSLRPNNMGPAPCGKPAERRPTPGAGHSILCGVNCANVIRALEAPTCWGYDEEPEQVRYSDVPSMETLNSPSNSWPFRAFRSFVTFVFPICPMANHLKG
jgi:hypothetical protein